MSTCPPRQQNRVIEKFPRVLSALPNTTQEEETWIKLYLCKSAEISQFYLSHNLRESKSSAARGCHWTKKSVWGTAQPSAVTSITSCVLLLGQVLTWQPSWGSTLLKRLPGISRDLSPNQPLSVMPFLLSPNPEPTSPGIPRSLTAQALDKGS